MSNNSKVVNRKAFCKDVELHIKWHGGSVVNAVRVRREADALARHFTLQTCRRWFAQYSVDNSIFNYENAVAVSH